jgi:dephospho-CoA kinase
MLKVGLSGNRYAGKDAVSRLFEQIKIPVFDADIVLKFILNYNFEINYKIRGAFGDAFSAPGDLLDIKKFKEISKSPYFAPSQIPCNSL